MSIFKEFKWNNYPDALDLTVPTGNGEFDFGDQFAGGSASIETNSSACKFLSDSGNWLSGANTAMIFGPNEDVTFEVESANFCYVRLRTSEIGTGFGTSPWTGKGYMISFDPGTDEYSFLKFCGGSGFIKKSGTLSSAIVSNQIYKVRLKMTGLLMEYYLDGEFIDSYDFDNASECSNVKFFSGKWAISDFSTSTKVHSVKINNGISPIARLH